MNLRICRSCGAEMAAEDAFCPECGAHVSDRPSSGPGVSAAPVTNAYDRPYERLDNLQPAAPDESATLRVGADGDPDPIRTFDAAMQLETDDGAEFVEPAPQRVSPVLVALAAVFVAIIVAGVVVAVSGGSRDGGATGFGGLAVGRPLSAGGFGSMMPDGTLVCSKGTLTDSGPRTAIAGAVEVLAPPATWSSRDFVTGRLPGTGPGSELTLNPEDHDRAVPQGARIAVQAIDPNVATFPDQFLVTALASGNATTVKQDCIDYGAYTALRVYRVELASGGTLATRYVVLYDKLRRGSAALFVFDIGH